MSKRNFDVIVRFSVEAETPEEAMARVFTHTHASLPDGMARETIGVWPEEDRPEDATETTEADRLDRLERLSISFARAIRYMAEQEPRLLNVHDEMHTILSEMGGLYAWEKAGPAAKDTLDVPR